MDASLNPDLTRLHKNDVHTLHGEPGCGVAVFRGDVWLTQEGDPRDVVLGAGDTFTFDRRGAVVVQALSDAGLFLYGGSDSQVDLRDSGFAAATRRLAANLRT